MKFYHTAPPCGHASTPALVCTVCRSRQGECFVVLLGTLARFPGVPESRQHREYLDVLEDPDNGGGGKDTAIGHHVYAYVCVCVFVCVT